MKSGLVFLLVQAVTIIIESIGDVDDIMSILSQILTLELCTPTCTLTIEEIWNGGV